MNEQRSFGSLSRLKIGESDVEVEAEEVFEDATSDISVLTRPISNISISSFADAHRRPAKMIKAGHRDLCVHSQKIQEPLFLRKCQKKTAKKGSAPPNVDPILKIERIRGEPKNSCQSYLLSGLDYPTYCVRYMSSNVVRKAKSVLVFRPPMQYIRFLARPDPMETMHTKFVEEGSTVKLMMSPEQAFLAKKMLPKWKTVTFTLAYGKHVAVKYRIIDTKKEEVQHFKANMEKCVRVSTKTLYRVEPVQRFEIWKSGKAHQLKLSTVEKCDPQMVKIAFLESGQVHGDQIKVIHSERKIKEVKTETEQLDVIWTRKETRNLN